MAEKLQIFQRPNFDDSIERDQHHPYYPRTTNFNLNDEIRITIQHQDVYTQPSDSYIYIVGKLSNTDPVGTGTCKLTNNAYAFLFEQIRFEINGVEIDRCVKPGITTTMKSYVSYSDNESKTMQLAGWSPFKDTQPTINDGKFSACIPLKFLLGFAENFTQILVNVSQELILIRAKTDDNCYINDTRNGTQKAKIEIDTIEWRVKHISVHDKVRLPLLKTLHNRKSINIAYRKWELFELPALRNTKNDIWPLKTSSAMEKPRFVIVGFQEKKKDNYLADASTFNHSSITNIKLHLNTETYPYCPMKLDMANKCYAIAYYMYANFQSSYYDGRINNPLMDYAQFYNCPLYVIDCFRQKETLTSNTFDIKLEMESEEAFKKDTAVYCLILHDAIIEYEPMSGIVKKIM